ncbi:hypothetical protein NEISUBOT_04465 [Neisseria subflava NJ9703]|uniref:Uncharacterized protein n=1 Tax=Neisseria subflava NJ9703 TaxID=546268 RepID=A0A9W5IQX0_NEISU|nr:hypothetical protein NEISUBOT_04465 [Neisseria subflava NJ9703]
MVLLMNYSWQQGYPCFLLKGRLNFQTAFDEIRQMPAIQG